MKAVENTLHFSATDLSTFSACRRASLLYREAARGTLPAPPYRDDPALRLLQERGQLHEAGYRKLFEVQHGEAAFSLQGAVLETEHEWQQATEGTVAAMKAGHRILFQAPLCHGPWRGRADFLERVDHHAGTAPSILGAYHYRALDTKLAQKPRASAILQLCVYSEILTRLQGIAPEEMVLVSPAGAPTAAGPASPKAESFRTADYAAYFRRIRRRMEAFVALTDLEHVYPEVCEHCDLCAWWSSCNQRRRDDDHLSFVAGLSRRDQRLLESSGVTTLEKLGKLQLPMAERPKKLRQETLQRLQHQAQLQLEARLGTPKYELITPVLEGKGLRRLPEPTAGDIFFDVEADRYAVDGTFVYLFGWVELDQSGTLRFQRLWATNRAEERANFEKFVDHVRRRRNDFEDLHVYHFAHSEKTVLGELSGRYASREDEVDDLLREEVLCDLLPIVKQALRAGVETYSLKDLEQFHGFTRQTDLRQAAHDRRIFELAREGGAAKDLPRVMTTIENYNREDCESTFHLRNWLEVLRGELQTQGVAIERSSPRKQDDTTEENLTQWLRRVEDLRRRLLRDVPSEPADRTKGHVARQLLADVLDWHRRKEKPMWREYFRVAKLNSEECFEESGPIGKLGTETSVGSIDRSQGYEYTFPAQDYKIKVDDVVECPVTNQTVGTVYELKRDANSIVVKRTKTLAAAPVALAVKPEGFRPGALQGALGDIADSLAATDFGLDTSTDDDEWGAPELTYPAARALLMREAPQLAAGVQFRMDGESAATAAVRIAPHLRQTVLAIQGPPGAGKSHTASQMVLELLRRGKRVGITAMSHKVIGNLLRKVHEAADQAGVPLHSLQKVSSTDQGFVHPRNLVTTQSGQKLQQQLEKSAKDHGASGRLLAGTQYFWASSAMRDSVDVLLVDEAGQFSLANALTVTVATDSLVLLGDPQQLAAPDEGTHPPGAGASALEHMLDGQATVPADRGIFLDQTWRLPPAIARFTSEHFYAGRLQAHPDCAKQALHATASCARFAGAGLFFERVEHSGNVSSSMEEATHIASLVGALLDGSTTWTDRQSATHDLRLEHILIVAPYNAQVQLISEQLNGAGLHSARVGTVDKFQGQEAPVVIYSMTTSSPEDAPHGFEFLFELERLNVATSRAQAVAILVTSPRLLEAECKTPRQMRLVNGLCGAVEATEQQE